MSNALPTASLSSCVSVARCAALLPGTFVLGARVSALPALPPDARTRRALLAALLDTHAPLDRLGEVVLGASLVALVSERSRQPRHAVRAVVREIAALSDGERAALIESLKGDR